MTNYHRHKRKGGIYFFTVNIADRRKTLLTERIDVLRDAFRQVKAHHPFTMDAIVILPDHLHTIWTLPKGDDDFSLRWRQIKSAFHRSHAPAWERNSTDPAVRIGTLDCPPQRSHAGAWER
ncbi:transposase [Methylomonas sp. MV1]|uniref:REP-associated tyrosine transposase n=1 Tax=Methylomonas sp. MV1 TaxID=3073620 RepID=UPI0028A4801D|nr:transposase [Methylomonas sp. MV1]MDT4329108.1 transposase [Methylomonas sp. MV1]